jgi:hypothetical protein
LKKQLIEAGGITCLRWPARNIQIAEKLAPMSPLQLCGLAARATTGIGKSVEGVACQDDDAILMMTSLGQSRAKFGL